MVTIEMNGVTLTLTEESAATLQREIEEEREEKREHWLLWNWYARRWAMYGDKGLDGSLFSDLYKDLNGSRPHTSREEIFWILYERDNWIEHDLCNRTRIRI